MSENYQLQEKTSDSYCYKTFSEISNVLSPMKFRVISKDEEFAEARKDLYKGYNAVNMMFHKGDWLKHLISIRYIAEGRKFSLFMFPYDSVQTCVVEMIYTVCEEMNQPAETRYLTVELYDRYLVSMGYTNIENKIRDSKIWNWQLFISNTNSSNNYTMLLHIISCLQLASKYYFNSRSKNVTIKKAQVFFEKTGVKCSKSNIIASERKVFKALNFQIGVPTMLTYVNALLHFVYKETQQDFFDVCIKILDGVYLQRHKIFHRLNCVLKGKSNLGLENRLQFLAVECDGLYCAAAILVTAMRVTGHKRNFILNINDKIASYIQYSGHNVIIFSTVILQILNITVN